MMKPPAATAAALAVILLSSCVQKFSPAQRAALATVSVASAEVPGDAYSEPYGGDHKGAEGAAMVGTNSGTGALGGVVGSLVGESIAATQNTLYRNSHKNSFAAVQSNTPQVGPILTAHLWREMKNDRFFGQRMRGVSPNRVTSKIKSYRLVRSGKNKDGELLLSPQITAEIHLTDAAGKSLAGRTYVGTGYSNPIATYAGSAAKTKDGYEFASRMAAEAFTTDLALKTAD